LPVSGNDKTWWPDLSAGAPGAIWSAITGPGRALTGDLPTPYTRGKDYQYGSGLNPYATTNPEDALSAAQTGASLMSPMPTATRALTPRPGFLPPPRPFTTAEETAAAALPQNPSGALPYYSLGATRTPTAAELAGRANDQYAAIRATGNMVPGGALANWANTTQQALLNNHSAIPETAPMTFRLLDRASNAPTGSTVNFNGVDALRQGLSDISGQRTDNGGLTSDARAASIALRELNPFIDTVDPLAPTARANWAASQRSQTLTSGLGPANTGIGEGATAQAGSSHSGMNFDNALRGRLRSFLANPDNVRGFSQGELDALNEIVQGGTVQNTARRVSNFMGGGGGLGALASMGIGRLLFGEGAEFAMPAVGTGIKMAENAAAQRALDRVDVMTRQRSPLYEQNRARGLLEQPNYLPGGTTDYAHLRSQFPLGLLAPTPPGVQDPPPAGPPYLVPPMPRLGFPGVTSWFGRGS
jgi:hypothetical protein